MLRPFRSGYLRSEALVVSGGEIYLPLIIINYMLVWMERKKKNCEWKLIYQCLDRSAIVQWEMYTTCFMGSEHISVRNSYVEEGYFFLFSLSDLLLPVNSCECVAQDFLSICKSKKFFFSLFSSFLFCLYSLTSWKNENERMAGEKTFSAAGVNLKEPV